MTDEIVKPDGREIEQSEFDLLSPMASQSLFWKTRYLADSPALRHVPLLFWVTETLRPSIAVTLGVRDAVPHFAICQAVEKLGLDGFCYGIDPSEADNDNGFGRIRDFNEGNFDDFSHILQQDLNGGSGFLHGGKIDLLVINHPESQALFDSLDSTWLPNLSDRAVIVFIRGGSSESYGKYIHRLTRHEDLFFLDTETQASLVLRGDRHPNRLKRLAGLKIGKPGYLPARTVFARLGELHVKILRLQKYRQTLQEVQSEKEMALRELDRVKEKLTKKEVVLDTLEDQLKERSALITTTQAEKDAERDKFERTLEKNQTRIRTLLQDLEAMRDVAENSETERDALRAELNKARGQVETLQQQLTDTLSSFQALMDEVKRAEAETKAARTEAAEAISERDGLEAELDVVQTKLDEQLCQNSELTAQLDAAEAEKRSFEEQLAAQNDTLEERFKDIAVLGNLIKTLEQETEALKNEATETKSAERLQMEEECASLRKHVQALQQQLVDLEIGRVEQKKLKELMREKNQALTDRNEMIKNLQADLENAKKELDKRAVQIQRLENSTSWRITAPLRKISSNLKRR